MATKMSFNYFQSQKPGGTLPQNSGKDMEVSQDLHLKMSKKIAQLTKVIYALNTRNDEHESIVQNLKDSHEEDIQRLLADTKKKISVYQTKMASELESKRRIESLEASVVQHQQRQEKALSDFERFKRKAEEELCNAKKSHAEKIVEISQDVLVAKREFAENVEKFEEFRNRFNCEKHRELEELKKRHEEELNSVRNFQGSRSEEMQQEVTRLKDKHREEVEALNDRYDLLHKDKVKAEEDYELKLEKAQAFYEKELAVVKQEQMASQDSLIQNLKNEHEKSRKDFVGRESELRKQSESLIGQLADSEEKVEQHEARIKQLESLLQDTDSNSQGLLHQMNDLQQKLESCESCLKVKVEELSTLDGMLKEQMGVLESKTELVRKLEEEKREEKERMVELESAMTMLHSKVEQLEREKQTLFSQQQNLSDQQVNQLRSLQQSLDDVSIEKKTMEQRYEREIQGMKDRHSNREKEEEDKYTAMLKDLREKLDRQLSEERQEHQDKVARLQQEWSEKMEAETRKLSEEKESILAEFQRVKTELFNKLQAAEAQVMKLEQSVSESEQGLGSASTHISNLKDAATKLKTDLDNTRSELKKSKTAEIALQGELDKLRLQRDSQFAELELSAQVKLEALKTELDSKWEETLRNETSKVRKEITAQLEGEKNAKLLQLTWTHEHEVKVIIEEWESKVTSLNLQVSDLQRSANRQTVESAGEIERLRDEMKMVETRLKQELVDAGNDYSRKVAVMETAQQDQISSLLQRQQKDLMETEKKLKDKHMEDMQIQLTAHRAAVQNIQEQADKLRHDREITLTDQHQQDKEKLRVELSEKLDSDLETMRRKHESAMTAARIELERALELSKQKDRANNSRIEELQNEIEKRERTVNNLEDEIRALKRSIDQLKKDMKQRDLHVKNIQQEAKFQIQKLEEDFRVEYERNLDNLQTDHTREVEAMLLEFNNAQHLLKEKISTIQLQLEEAEERYRNRESRPEDLELILQLRDAIAEREQRVKDLIDEKRFFQLELVNRETNFNKIFSTAPNIGVLNPLTVKPKGKKGEKVPLKHSSAPTLSTTLPQPQRLEPLPNSPLHDNRINPSKPLPTPTFHKKFVK